MFEDAPIYAELVREFGDVPAEVGRAASLILREAEWAIDFSSLRAVARAPALTASSGTGLKAPCRARVVRSGPAL
ncbi:hypothetical protein [Streptomyces collinus]|uniref:hypothetical protein n=1 Tax=Streptomyces collinus TaxID=42684 RepID=UPI00340EB4B3